MAAVSGTRLTYNVSDGDLAARLAHHTATCG